MTKQQQIEFLLKVISNNKIEVSMPEQIEIDRIKASLSGKKETVFNPNKRKSFHF